MELTGEKVGGAIPEGKFGKYLIPYRIRTVS